MDQTGPGNGGAGGTDRARVSRRRFLAGAAATTTVWAAPAVARLAVALPQAVVSPPPQAAGTTTRHDRPGPTVAADPEGALAAGGLDATDGPSGASTNAWKLAATTSWGLAAGAWAFFGPHRRPGRPRGGAGEPAEDE